jgi:glycosyltransferase involved in cell wall biosynthesis
VRLCGPVLALAAPGGGETQLLATAEALRRQGIDARAWRPWEDGLRGIGWLHLMGSRPEFLPLAAAARRHGVRVALSPIAWFDLRAIWGEPSPVLRRLAACGKFLLRAAVPRLPSWRRRLYHSVDLLLPNSQAEAAQLLRYFGVPPHRVRVVPNAAEARFTEADPQPFAQRYGSGYVLCAGRIEPRKNQLNLLCALRGCDVPVVILGDPVAGHEAYARRCRQAAGPQVQFVPRLAHDDPLLRSAYAAAGCLALPSWFETPGLVALEAALTGTPLVLTARGSAREYFGPHAHYVEPDDLPGIRRAVLHALEQPRCARRAQWVRTHFTWDAAARATLAAYEEVA